MFLYSCNHGTEPLKGSDEIRDSGSITGSPGILIVDDRLENLVALEAVLEDCNTEVTSVTSGPEALAIVLEKRFALILLDVQLPGMDGFEVAELLRSNTLTKNVPIVFVTALNREKHYVFKGYEAGAVDYLSKPLDPFILRSKVKVFLELWHQKNELQELIADLETAYLKIESQQQTLKEQAIRDHLTGLYQRRWFDEVAEKEISRSLRHNLPLSLAMVDIDHFKKVNDTFGHAAGDAVLVQVTRIMEKSVRTADLVFRFGGEEFVVLMPNTDLFPARMVCERIRNCVSDTSMTWEDRTLRATVSIGICELLEIGNQTADGLVHSADTLLYSAKSKGRNRVVSQDTEKGPSLPS